MNTNANILAIASPPGSSLRGIVRGSGPRILELMDPYLDGGFKARSHNPMRSIRVKIDSISLPSLVLSFQFPHSYTGEDQFELHVVGNPLLMERLIDAVLKDARHRGFDVRRAEPGEFTARAYLNGKMDLIAAEGVAATIAAQSDAELRAAEMLSSGQLSDIAHGLADDLAGSLALVEAGIDFTDQEDVVAISPIDLNANLLDLRHRIDRVLQRSVGLESLEEIPWVVFKGPTNAGKSTLFNALLGHERAVVSSMAGTTRDVLTEPMAIDTAHGHAEVMLVDLAGTDDEDTLVNNAMRSVATDALRRAELILHCIPVGMNKPDVRGNEMVVTTKVDLAEGPRPMELAVCAQRGDGLAELKNLIAHRLADRAVSLESDLMVLQARHETALRQASEHLREALKLVGPYIEARMFESPELTASAMRAALDELAALAGDITPDDVLGKVFASFCVGK